MEKLEARVLHAQKDVAALEQLLGDYLPFIKKQLVGLQALELEYEDMLSLAMLTFIGCARQYRVQRGGFIGFCEVCIRNRLIDEARRQNSYTSRVVPLEPAAIGFPPPEAAASIDAYDRAQEQRFLRDEIERLTQALSPFGVKFSELPRICPKQSRSRMQCLAIARAMAENEAYRTTFMAQRRLPQTELALSFGISRKTVEKHRKYIITLIVLLTGDYPGIRSYLPQEREVE